MKFFFSIKTKLYILFLNNIKPETCLYNTRKLIHGYFKIFLLSLLQRKRSTQRMTQVVTGFWCMTIFNCIITEC